MKKLTICFVIFLGLPLAGTVVYLLAGPDFTAPAALAAQDEDPDAPVWNMTMDDLIDYLEEKGFWDRSDMQTISEGVADQAFFYDYIEIYWWDLDNVNEDSPEFRAYMDMKETGQIDLYGRGINFMATTKNGPFGLNSTFYGGDVKALEEAFLAFGH